MSFNAGGNYPLNSPNANVTISISFWGGTQPTAANFATNYMATYNSTMLLNLNGVVLYQPNADTADLGIGFVNNGVPTAQTPYNSGTITWAALWQANITTPVGTNIPSSYPRYALLPVTDSAGSGIIRFANTTVSTATPATFVDFSIVAAGGIA